MKRRPKFLAPAASATVVVAGLLLSAAGVRAGELAVAGVDKNITKSLGKEDPVPLNVFDTNFSYVGEAGFRTRQFDGAGPNQSARSYGKQDEYHSYVSAARRVPLGLFDNKLFFKFGAAYERFDFGTTTAPLPTTVQNVTGTLGVEYIVQGRPAIFFETKPGVFFSDWDDITTGSFDSPTVVAVSFPIVKNVYGIAGVRGSLLGKYPVLPIGGLVWVIRDNLRLEAIPPEPRLIYTFSEKLDFFVGGDLLGETYRRDRVDNPRTRQEREFSQAIIDYSEYRIGAGVTLTPVKGLDIDLSGGYVPQRTFHYYRTDSDKRFKTYGAPYAKISIKAEF